MDPWTTESQQASIVQRRVPWTSVPDSRSPVDTVGFLMGVEKAREFGCYMASQIFYTWPIPAKNPAEFVLSRNDAPLPKRGGTRWTMAAIILHQTLLELELLIHEGLKKAHRYAMRDEMRRCVAYVRRQFRAMIQSLLTFSWARLHLRLRSLLFNAFSDPDTGMLDLEWKKICRGSLSCAYVVRAFQGIFIKRERRKKKPQAQAAQANSCEPCEATCFISTRKGSKLPKLKPQRSSPSRRWVPSFSTTEEDNLLKLDVFLSGQLKGFGKVILCAQVKTGSIYHAEVLLSDPADDKKNDPHRDMKDALWEGFQYFQKRPHGTARLLPLFLQTGGAAEQVTLVVANANALRVKIHRLLAKLRRDLLKEKHEHKKRHQDDSP